MDIVKLFSFNKKMDTTSLLVFVISLAFTLMQHFWNFFMPYHIFNASTWCPHVFNPDHTNSQKFVHISLLVSFDAKVTHHSNKNLI